MAFQRTFAIIKPDAVKLGTVGRILSEIEASGLTLGAMRLTSLDPQRCQAFYAEHVGKPFYPSLESFMIEGPLVVLRLEGEEAILRWRELMGATDPAKAAPDSLRARFGTSHTRNAVHGSDSPASAERELAFFFPEN